MMKIPTQFSLGGTVWTVKQVEHLGNCGETHRDEALILLKKEMKPQAKMQTFLHELLHAMKYAIGDNATHDEQEVDAMATMLHQFMRTAR